MVPVPRKQNALRLIRPDRVPPAVVEPGTVLLGHGRLEQPLALPAPRDVEGRVHVRWRPAR